MVKFNVFLIIGGARFSSYSLGEINEVCTKVRRNGLLFQFAEFFFEIFLSRSYR